MNPVNEEEEKNNKFPGFFDYLKNKGINWQVFISIFGFALTFLIATLAYKPVFSTKNFLLGRSFIVELSSNDIKKIDSIARALKKIDSATKIYTLNSEKGANRFVLSKIDSLSKEFNKDHTTTLGLRQAINPLHPEEILTLARLQDQVKILTNANQDLEKKLLEKQNAFQDAIIRELDSSSKQTYLIMAVLAPLILNFLYQLWKDVKANSAAVLPSKKSDKK
jgi:uncharacterized coiled-coil protein SlyX